AKTHMDRFTRMTQSKVASAMSLAYGDQGPLSLAAAARVSASAAPAIPVTFVPARVGFLMPGIVPSTPTEAGPGGCFLDADGDGTPDYVALSPIAPTAMLYLNRGGTFAPVASS